MKRFLDATRRLFSTIGEAAAIAGKAAYAWLSIPVNFCLAILGLVFLVSFSAWAFGARFETAILYFPDQGHHLRGETRQVPRGSGGEARAELIASELLLGPTSSYLEPAFPTGTRLLSAIYRKGVFFLDLSEDAVDPEAGPDQVRLGMLAMERSLKAAMPGMKRLDLTIGGIEPFAEALKQAGNAAPGGQKK